MAPNLNGRRLILGSGSPRRKELLAGLDLEFTIDTGNSFKEEYEPGTRAEDVPMLMSVGKSHGFHRPLEPDEILITADTVVLVDSPEGRVVLGKPHGREDAIRMLKTLSGCTHEVMTAVTIRDAEKEETFTDTASVSFRSIPEEAIEYYVDNYKPFDKAGAYGIQEWIGYVAIDRIDGSFYNVMGLPVQKVYSMLLEFIR